MPTWLLIVLLVLATYRLTRLVVKDDFPPVLWLRDRMVGGWRPLTEKEWAAVRGDSEAAVTKYAVRDVDHGNGPVSSRYLVRARWVPQWLADLLSCPWCASGWVALALVVAVAFTTGVPVPLLVWPAVWGAAALLAARDWS
jgi:Protein of unknown function (DUF1360)